MVTSLKEIQTLTGDHIISPVIFFYFIPCRVAEGKEEVDDEASEYCEESGKKNGL